MKKAIYLLILITLTQYSKTAWYDFWNWGKVKESFSELTSGDHCITYFNSEAEGKCRTCEAGYFVNPNQGVYECQKCIPNCGTCYDTEYCEKCKVGFYRKTERECGSCITGCNQCENSQHCEKCKNGFFHTIDLTCLRCPTHCKMCLEKGKCKECELGFYLNSSGGCSTCADHCDECHVRFHCEKCEDGYSSGVDGTCVKKKNTWLLYLGFFLVGAFATCALCYYLFSRSREPTVKGYNGPNGYELWNGGSGANQPTGGWSGSTAYDHPGAKQPKPFFEKQYNQGYGQFNPATGGYDKGGNFESDRGYQ